MKHFSGYRDEGLGGAFYLFILPAFVLYFVFFLLPFFLGIQYSFLNWNGKTPDIPIQIIPKKFELLVDKNLPIEISKNDFEKKFLPQIVDEKEYIENLYLKNKAEDYYILDLTLTDDVYEKAEFILKQSNCTSLLSDTEKEKLHTYYENQENIYLLKSDVSFLDRSYIKKTFAQVYYHNIKNVGLKNYKRLFHDGKFK